ncbi:hypothetical protein KSF_079860 [Reticulibacter mediterranei]|uniref:Uncharacterized protein n=1 Tax=Reticulibacter mediterranei TaxID=2778369 RepID=A0A8J3IPS7_9CHLR|nr:hypothetical protein KSF_079860 [Reticulibacter mediterranei]
MISRALARWSKVDSCKETLSPGKKRFKQRVAGLAARFMLAPSTKERVESL